MQIQIRGTLFFFFLLSMVFTWPIHADLYSQKIKKVTVFQLHSRLWLYDQWTFTIFLIKYILANTITWLLLSSVSNGSLIWQKVCFERYFQNILSHITYNYKSWTWTEQDEIMLLGFEKWKMAFFPPRQFCYWGHCGRVHLNIFSI